jgi:hypothetical protein
MDKTESTVRNMLTAIEAPLYDIDVLSDRGMLPGLDGIPAAAGQFYKGRQISGLKRLSPAPRPANRTQGNSPSSPSTILYLGTKSTAAANGDRGWT